MRVILNPKHADHAPPGEWESGAVIPCYEGPGRLAAIRAALDAAGGFTFEEPPKPNEECVAAVHHPAYVTYLREASAEARKARDPAAKQLWPTVFPFGPNPRATGPRALRVFHVAEPADCNVREGPKPQRIALGFGIYAPFGFRNRYSDDVPFRTLAKEGRLTRESTAEQPSPNRSSARKPGNISFAGSPMKTDVAEIHRRIPIN